MPTLHEPIHAPDFQGGEWLNSEPLSLAALRGKIVLLDFWDYTCINCLRTLPYLSEWWHRYRELGLMVIGVHSPEFSFARDRELVRHALEQLRIEYPILLDGELRTWQVWANRYWPSKYLVDAQGYIRYFHYGEGQYHECELAIQHLLRENRPDISLPPIMQAIRPSDMPGASCFRATPEQYLGYRRGHIGNLEGYTPDQVVGYTLTIPEKEDTVMLGGTWMDDIEGVILAGGTGDLAIRYHGKDVNIVASPPKNCDGLITLQQDGHPLPVDALGSDVRIESGQSVLRLGMPRMYHIIANPHFGTHHLHLHITTPGVKIYTLTFVTECRSKATRKGMAA